nr:universal stress protein A-like protein [Ipomoea batatas]
MIAVNESTMKGYPHPSISSKGAFEWTLDKIVRSNTAGFKLLFLHVQGSRSSDRKTPLIGVKSLVAVSCEAWIKRGDPKDVICHEVQRVHPDLLVVGCRGLGPFQRVFVGTVSEFCVKHAECPVVTIKRSASETPQDPVDD